MSYLQVFEAFHFNKNEKLKIKYWVGVGRDKWHSFHNLN